MKLLLVLFISLNVYAGPFPPNHCHVKPNVECEKNIKKRLSSRDYNEDSDLRRIEYTCAGNPGGACIDKLSKKLPWYNLNNLEDLTKIALSCALTNMSCLNYVSSKLSRLDMRDLHDAGVVAKACARAESSCVKKACRKDFDCDNKEQLLDAARSCYQVCK
ncbi:MAG: hypothetical protein KC478_11320 [Bacteriovoracaceae bacterium]|nr:hypothetical protein [Bacteriovoracaceae bacterium]